MGFDDGGAARQRAVHHRVDFLGIQVLGQRGRSDHVEEQDADLPQGLGWLGGGACGQVEELGAQGRKRRFDDRVAQQRALGFERGDAGEELLLLRRHSR